MEPITYRVLDEKDRAEVKEVWQYCFKDTKEFVELYFDRCFQRENTIGAYKGERLLASAQLNPYTVKVRGADLPVDYVVGVETAPEARGEGAAGGLLRALLQESVRRGHYLSLLMPFSTGFYYKYDWRFCYHHLRYHLQTAELKPLCVNYGQIRRIDPLADMAVLDEIYRAFCRAYHGYVLRTRDNWEIVLRDLLLSGGHCAILYGEQGAAEGYVLYTFDHEELSVLEMAYTNYRAKGGLMQYLYHHRSQLAKITLLLPADDESYRVLENKECAVASPFMMVRIADVAGLLTSLHYEYNIFLKIKVNDPLMANNNNIFALSVQNGRAQVTPAAEDWDLEIGIGELSALVMGAEQSRKLRAAGKITVNNEEAFAHWQMLWPEQTNFINEYY